MSLRFNLLLEINKNKQKVQNKNFHIYPGNEEKRFLWERKQRQWGLCYPNFLPKDIFPGHWLGNRRNKGQIQKFLCAWENKLKVWIYLKEWRTTGKVWVNKKLNFFKIFIILVLQCSVNFCCIAKWSYYTIFLHLSKQ